MALLKRLNFLKNVLTERKTICNIERANNTNDSENDVSNDGENCFNKEYEINVESHDIEMNSAGTSETVMVSAQTSTTEVNIEERLMTRKRTKSKKI